jgi:hypothetical protein
MEDNRKSDERRLRRCYQCNRLEEELWAMAYGEVWPLIRKALTVQQWSESADQRRTWFVSKQKIGA